MNVAIIMVVCLLAAAVTRAVQTKYFPKTVADPKDYKQHAKFVAIYAVPFVVVSAMSYMLVPMAVTSRERVPSVEQLKVMMKERVVDTPVPAITKVI